ncbi:MAG: TetR family transcriptional regulator [Sulfobacillus benefaciens]|uniref:TetR family transcriptional regulator n=1 Tax=Sulfobacillus benefaciens TaxID=453960 RepID=A0A2T2XF87_9FIRM|nr:MAG: TetR family transcriptional regulator [Sulfobacillus benefaciens]
MKDAIVRAAMQLFDARGFRETSIQDICDAVGVTKGAFYYYFTSKEELLMEIHQEYIDDLLKSQEEILNGDSSASDKVLLIMELLMNSIQNNRSAAKIFFAELRQLGGDRLHSIIAKRRQFRKNLESVVCSGMDGREFRTDLDCGAITMAILGIVNWSYQWFQPDGRFPSYELTRQFHRIIVSGIMLDP